MQELIFSIVRTFPFWAIPLGAALISSTWGAHAQKMAASRRGFLVIFGICLFIASGFFLYFQGHDKAVPLVHEFFYPDSRISN